MTGVWERVGRHDEEGARSAFHGRVIYIHEWQADGLNPIEPKVPQYANLIKCGHEVYVPRAAESHYLHGVDDSLLRNPPMNPADQAARRELSAYLAGNDPTRAVLVGFASYFNPLVARQLFG
jgi:hypothetical protein